jgi:hypothetical protein
MSLAQDILRVLRENPTGLSDGDLARRFGKYHSHVHQTCVRLAEQGLIHRDTTVRPLINRIADAGRKRSIGAASSSATPLRAPSATAPADGGKDWYWEGNVQGAVVSHLVRQGWRIMRAADTSLRERGTDIVAQRDATVLHVEVKGWPSASYADPARAGEQKRTLPTAQAGTYFGGAVLSALQLRDRAPADEVALAFPDMPRYRALASDVAQSLGTLRVSVLFVSQDGTVTTGP